MGRVAGPGELDSVRSVGGVGRSASGRGWRARVAADVRLGRWDSVPGDVQFRHWHLQSGVHERGVSARLRRCCGLCAGERLLRIWMRAGEPDGGRWAPVPRVWDRTMCDAVAAPHRMDWVEMRGGDCGS